MIKFIIISSLILSSFVYAENVTVAFDDAYPPYMYGQEKAQGLYPKIIEAVFKKMNVNGEFKAMAWSRATSGGESGQFAVGGIYKNEKRMQIYDYSSPLYTEKMFIYVKKGKTFSYSKIEDLKGKIVGINRGWSYGDDFDKAKAMGIFKVDESYDSAINFGKLAVGRVDCYIADQISAEKIINKDKLKDKVEVLPTPFGSTEGYLVLAKKTNKLVFIQKFNEALASLKADKSYEKIIEEFTK